MDNHNHRPGKRVRDDSGCSMVAPLSDGAVLNASPPSPPNAASAPVEGTMVILPTVALSYIASFGGNLSGACRSTLEAVPELHYKISIKDRAESFSIAEDPGGALSLAHMGLQPSGALATGRVVTQITVTGCTDYKDTTGGYQILEKAVQRVVEHSIPTLRSITVAGSRGKDSGRVAAIIGALVPNSSKRHRVAPKLTRVELRHAANGVVKAGNAIGAGLWPALEELIVPNCHGNKGHFFGLSKALSEGSAPNLRVLNWGNQSCIEEGVDDSVLRALSAGKCPRVERISFTDSFYGSRSTLETLVGMLQACSTLRVLRMDCTDSPGKQLRDLTAALRDGLVPCLRFLSVRTQSYHISADGSSIAEDAKALKTAASLRSPLLCLEVK